MKKSLAIILTMMMLLSILPMSVFAEGVNATKLIVDSADAFPGDTFNVDVKVQNNPGIVSANINVAFDENLTLVGATKGDVFPADMSYIPPRQLSTTGRISSSCNFAWSGTDIAAKDIKDGTMVTLTFEVSENAQIGDEYSITVSARKSDIVDKDAQAVEIQPAIGKVSIIDYKPGDVNDDGEITMMDTLLINRYIVDGCKYDPNGYAIKLNENAADVNDDDAITMLDVLLINRYIVDDCKYVPAPDGYGVELKHKTQKCLHTFEAFEANEATCTEDGNIAYWHCTKCGKYFADENGATVIMLSDTVILAKGHTPVIDPYEAPTETTPGLTEGSHCEICKIVLVPQDLIPVPEAKTYNIVYHLWDNDTDYLKEIDLDNSANPTSKDCSKALRLQPIPDENLGFNFLYWYQKGDDKATTIIDANTMDEDDTIHLYAKWEKVNYKIQFDSDLVPVEADTYTVDETKVLPTPTLDGYIFTGWSDSEGEIIRRIPQGETGKKVYTANWMSERNQAWTNKVIDEPIIFEDEENKQIIFAYEVGEIRNVPVQVIHDFGKINGSGVSKTVTKEFTKKVSSTEMTNYTSTVSKATTESFGWALSNGWSDQTTVNSEWCKENGITEEEAKEICTNDTNGWYVSNGSSGYDTTTTYGSTDTRDLKTTTKNTKTYNNKNTQTRQDFSSEVDVSTTEKISISNTTEAHVGVDIEGVGSAGGSNSTTIEGSIEAKQELSLQYSNGKTVDKKTGKDVDNGSGTDSGTITKTGSDNVHNSSWNSESGTSASHSVTETESVMRAVSQKTSEKTGYGESYIKNGNEQSSENIANQTSSSDSYGGSVTFATEESEKVTETYSTQNTVSGFHRWVNASTAHVFAAVGYDIATSSYYVFNYTIMDDKTFEYEDYSYNDSNYEDHQSGVITFDIPNDIEDYVKDRVLGSGGLEFSRAGLVTAYSGKDDFVIIPEYAVINGPAGNSVVKVAGIDSKAFSNRDDIVGIELSDFITEIPNNAFVNCSELQYITAKNFTKIGSNAFTGCSKLTYASINDTVTQIGENAFVGVTDLAVNAANKDIVELALNSGAKNIMVKVADDCDNLENTTLTVPSSVKTVIFDGSAKSFKDVYFNSDADRTIIRNSEFISTGITPIKISSPDVSLQEIKVSAPGIAMAFTDSEAKVSLFGESFIASANENALLCKGLELNKIESNLNSQLHVSGNILVCDTARIIVSNGYLNETNGNIIAINDAQFEKYLKGTIKVNFNANDGNVSETEKMAFYGSEIGTLPVPTRDYYRFDGWYSEDGRRYNDDTIVYSVTDLTLVAHWIQNDVKEEWVHASQLPSGAEVTDRKWTYNLREYTSNGASWLDGWTKYDTQRTGWGSTQGPVYGDPNNGSRNVWSESYVSGYGTKHTWHFHKFGYSPLDYSYSVAGGGRTEYHVYLNYMPSTTGQRPVDKSGSTYRWFAEGTGSWAAVYFVNDYDETNYDDPRYSTRWYYQEPVYTYYYYRDLSKEATSNPTGQSNVSNVQEWVRYREK